MSTIEMRAQLGQSLNELMDTDDRFVVVNADLANANGLGGTVKKFPDRSFNVGVQEANMASFAAGMATYGYIPFIVTFAPFATRRIADQLMISISYAGTNVKVIGGDPGVTAELNGGTHMVFEDIAITRAMSGLTVVEPSDAVQLASLLPQIAHHPGPVYMRTYRKKAPAVYQQGQRFELGRAHVVRPGRDITLFASGIEVHQAVAAADLLAADGIAAEVVDIHTLKPLDAQTVVQSVRRTGAAVTCENHNVLGGLGSAVTEATAEHWPVPVLRIGSQDRKGQVGKLPFLVQEYELTAEHIAAKAARTLKIKNDVGAGAA
ncbi:MAG: transketolase family protein [Beutenbergiaceae bacterium]